MRNSGSTRAGRGAFAAGGASDAAPTRKSSTIARPTRCPSTPELRYRNQMIARTGPFLVTVGSCGAAFGSPSADGPRTDLAMGLRWRLPSLPRNVAPPTSRPTTKPTRETASKVAPRTDTRHPRKTRVIDVISRELRPDRSQRAAQLGIAPGVCCAGSALWRDLSPILV
jgi:hypothetical protein